VEPVKLLLFHKIDQEHWPVLKTFMMFLHYMDSSEMVAIDTNDELMEKLKGI